MKKMKKKKKKKMKKMKKEEKKKKKKKKLVMKQSPWITLACDIYITQNVVFRITARRHMLTGLYNLKYDQRVTILAATINNPITTNTNNFSHKCSIAWNTHFHKTAYPSSRQSAFQHTSVCASHRMHNVTHVSIYLLLLPRNRCVFLQKREITTR